jgi:hypothetical protein
MVLCCSNCRNCSFWSSLRLYFRVSSSVTSSSLMGSIFVTSSIVLMTWHSSTLVICWVLILMCSSSSSRVFKTCSDPINQFNRCCKPRSRLLYRGRSVRHPPDSLPWYQERSKLKDHTRFLASIVSLQIGCLL